jgi:hypothetical protein
MYVRPPQTICTILLSSLRGLFYLISTTQSASDVVAMPVGMELPSRYIYGTILDIHMCVPSRIFPCGPKPHFLPIFALNMEEIPEGTEPPFLQLFQ